MVLNPPIEMEEAKDFCILRWVVLGDKTVMAKYVIFMYLIK